MLQKAVEAVAPWTRAARSLTLMKVPARKKRTCKCRGTSATRACSTRTCARRQRSLAQRRMLRSHGLYKNHFAVCERKIALTRCPVETRILTSPSRRPYHRNSLDASTTQRGAHRMSTARPTRRQRRTRARSGACVPFILQNNYLNNPRTFGAMPSLPTRARYLT